MPSHFLALGAGFKIIEADLRSHELHQILVGGDDEHIRAAGLCLLRIGSDEVIGLVALKLHGLQAEGADRFAHDRHLDLQILRRVGAVALVILIEFLAERALGLVEHDGEMGGLQARRAVAHELQELGDEQAHGPRRHAVRAAGIVLLVLVHGLEVGPEDEGGAVDEENVVAGLDGTGGSHGSRA
jgi:hypothetical protein